MNMTLYAVLVIFLGIFLFYVIPKIAEDHNRTKIEVETLRLARADKECETAGLNLRFAVALTQARQKLADE